MPTERVTFTVEKNLLEELKKVAKAEKKSLSKVISEAVKEFIVERKRKKMARKLLELEISKEEEEKALKELERIRREAR